MGKNRTSSSQEDSNLSWTFYLRLVMLVSIIVVGLCRISFANEITTSDTQWNLFKAHGNYVGISFEAMNSEEVAGAAELSLTSTHGLSIRFTDASRKVHRVQSDVSNFVEEPLPDDPGLAVLREAKPLVYRLTEHKKDYHLQTKQIWILINQSSPELPAIIMLQKVRGKLAPYAYFSLPAKDNYPDNTVKKIFEALGTSGVVSLPRALKI